MLIPEECFFDGRFYTTCFVRKVVKFQFWTYCVPGRSSSVSEFLGRETSYQQGWLSFRNFVLFMQRDWLPKLKDFESLHEAVICI